jgi:hypothetical protein
MTGTDHHIAGLGNLIEWTNRSDQYDPTPPRPNSLTSLTTPETPQQKATPNTGPPLPNAACPATKATSMNES